MFCYVNKIQSVIIEGGKKTLEKFIESGYWDEARVFTSTKKIKMELAHQILIKKYPYSKNIEEIS